MIGDKVSTTIGAPFAELIPGGGRMRHDQRVILLAEDDELVRTLIQNVLTREGYSILCATDGIEALSLSRTHPGPIELLLTDVKMPKMDGLQLREHIRRERPETKVLLMSGRMSGEIPASDRAVNFLRKPFLVNALRTAKKTLL
jgi:two-component system cell cycle sensor histidine kinase/response regulator CckA